MVECKVQTFTVKNKFCEFNIRISVLNNEALTKTMNWIYPPLIFENVQTYCTCD